MTILSHIPTRTKRVGRNEYAGACPWCGGKDRFRVWPDQGESGRFWCRQCDKSGDAITLLCDFGGLSFREACESLGLDHKLDEKRALAPYKKREPTHPSEHKENPPFPAPPGEVWQARAREVAQEAVDCLWSKKGERALSYLRSRRFEDRTIRTASFGYVPEDIYEAPEKWGLSSDSRPLYIPRSITIPWVLCDPTASPDTLGDMWALRLRRLTNPGSDTSRYISVRGSKFALYNADFIRYGLAVILVEGEIDCWSVAQEAIGEDDRALIIPVATGSTTGARNMRWELLLSLASVVLVAYDSDEAGERAARYWLDRLPNARRWRPYWKDSNQMLQDGADLRAWIKNGLANAGRDAPEHTLQSTKLAV